MASEKLTRREFFKQTALGAGSLALVSAMLPPEAQTDDRSRVVIAHHPKATEGKRTIYAQVVQKMLDEALLGLTGQPDVASAWRNLLPGLQPNHTVAIKVNAVPAGNKVIPTHPEVVQAIVVGLAQAGLQENQIIIYDRESEHLAGAGYQVNAETTGVRCFGTTAPDWGYDADQPMEILGQRYLLSRILTRCDHLINVPVLKVHLDRYGVTLSLKNHYGTVDRPQDLHEDFAVACATLNAHPAIRDKTRLVVIDALFGCWGSQPMRWVVDFTPNSLIVSRDPVAADTLGTHMLNEERARQGQPPRDVPLLQEAARMELGVCDLKQIDRHLVEIG